MIGKNLWAWRWTVARGWIWVHERRVTEETAVAWENIYKIAEPEIKFVIAKKKPVGV